MTTTVNKHINKGQILGRMRKTAASLLGIEHTGLLDPAVNLLLESLSEEVYKIAGEIDNIENRILDKLSSMLLPVTDTITRPAHCVLQVSSKESVSQITTLSGFHHFDKTQNRSFAFYPACNTKIHNGKITYFIYKTSVYTVDRDLSKTLHFRGNQNTDMEDNIFWLGLQLDDSINTLSGLSFYFDLHGIFEKDNYLKLLPYTAWSHAGEAIETSKGIAQWEEEHENKTLALLSAYDLSNEINRAIKDYYNNSFLYITGNTKIKRETFPKELMPYFSERFTDAVDMPLVWIKIDCPQRMPSDIIDSIQVCINAVPVANKELVSKISEVKKTIPVIPLDTGCNESFISVQSLSDSQGKKYHDVPVKDDQNQRYGIYSFRRGGIERNDKRNALERLAGVTDALNREAPSFFENRKDLQKQEVRVNRLIKRLYKTLADEKDRHEIQNYLLVSPQKDSEVFFLDYWMTDGEEANGIRPGRMFTSLSGQFTANSLTPTVGGNYAPRASEKERLYQRSVGQHNLLVTDEDIRRFCLEEFKESVREVRVHKGFTQSDNPKLGFVETTDVHLKLVDGMCGHTGLNDNARYLKVLKDHSPGTFNYRIHIE